MSNLTKEMVSTFGVYFEHSKEGILFLYPKLDLSQTDFLKVVHGGKTMASLEPKCPTPIENNHDKDQATDGVDFGAPQPESGVEKEMS